MSEAEGPLVECRTIQIILWFVIDLCVYISDITRVNLVFHYSTQVTSDKIKNHNQDHM